MNEMTTVEDGRAARTPTFEGVRPAFEDRPSRSRMAHAFGVFGGMVPPLRDQWSEGAADEEATL